MKSNFSLPLKATVALSMLTAISIILGKYLAFGVGEVLRFSFENLPIIFAGITFGPIGGLLVGVCEDLIGCMLVGYTVNPLVTLGSALIGLVSGLVYRLFGASRSPRSLGIIFSVAAAHLVGSVAVKTIGLAMYYTMPIPILMLWRALNYLIVGALETIILIPLLKNKALSHQISLMKRHGR